MQKKHVFTALLVITALLVVSVLVWSGLNRSKGQEVGQLKSLARVNRDAPVYKSPRRPLADVIVLASPPIVAQNIIPVTGGNMPPIAQQYQYAVVIPVAQK